MAVPFRRTSKTKKRMRRTHFKLEVSGLVLCPNCGAMIKSHHVCPKCGYYNGKKVIKVDGDKKEVAPVAAPKAKKAKKAVETKVEETKAEKTAEVK
jgi:large subunit ribosomal protein L32